MPGRIGWVVSLVIATIACSSADRHAEQGIPAGAPPPDVTAGGGGTARMPPGTASVVYEVVFESAWPEAEAPETAHFSPLVGAAHAGGAPFWAVGAPASDAVAALAQTGSSAELEGALMARVGTDVCAVAVGSGIRASAGTARITLEVGARCPSISVVSMQGPSPDWFVGVSDLSLRQAGRWVGTASREAVVYDAGVNSAPGRGQVPAPTTPPEAVAECRSPAFRGVDGPRTIGVWRFTKLTGLCTAIRDPPPAVDPGIAGLSAAAFPGNALRETISFQTPVEADAVVLFWAAGDAEARVSRPSVGATHHAITLVGLREKTAYRYRVATYTDDSVGFSAEGGFETGAIPPEVPTYAQQVHLREVTDGFYQSVVHRGFTLSSWVGPVVAERTHTALTILDEEGRVVWYELVPTDAPWRPSRFGWTARGALLVTRNQGEVAEMLPDGRILRAMAATEWLPLHHEVFETPDGKVVALATVERTVDLSGLGGAVDARVVGDGIVVLGADGQAAWEWSTFDVLDPAEEPYTSSGYDGSVRWLKARALTTGWDGSYLVGLDLAGAILKVDAQTGEIRWRLGGARSDFTMSEAAVFLRPHHLTALPNRHLLMFDEGAADRPSGRVLELIVDEGTMTADVAWKYALPQSLYGGRAGGATRLANGNTLVVSGESPAILEVTRQGEVVWQVQGPPGASYRALSVSLDGCDPVPAPSRP